jgi:DNA/RNA-binding domain of Phe-tRNA-synthetase-like protein
MIAISLTPDWKTAYPEGAIGLLEVSGVNNSAPSPALEAEKRRLEADLRRRHRDFTRRELLALPVLAAYHAYYRRFDKTYHVLLQLESLLFKGRDLPQVSPLVDANFMAEMEVLTLAASHDADRLQPPITLDICRPGDLLHQMGGALRLQLPGDMAMREATGLACTILYGQDDRSPVTPATTHALYVVYAPPGVGRPAVAAHIGALLHYIKLFAPGVVVEQAIR